MCSHISLCSNGFVELRVSQSQTHWICFLITDAVSMPANFAKREFSFTLENDIYVRYQSYVSEKDFKNDVLNKKPHKIDIGAVYNARVEYFNHQIDLLIRTLSNSLP
jgi:hypothetical protein